MGLKPAYVAHNNHASLAHHSGRAAATHGAYPISIIVRANGKYVGKRELDAQLALYKGPAFPTFGYCHDIPHNPVAAEIIFVEAIPFVDSPGPVVFRRQLERLYSVDDLAHLYRTRCIQFWDVSKKAAT
jgi:hypothetical protein